MGKNNKQQKEDSFGLLLGVLVSVVALVVLALVVTAIVLGTTVSATSKSSSSTAATGTNTDAALYKLPRPGQTRPTSLTTNHDVCVGCSTQTLPLTGKYRESVQVDRRDNLGSRLTEVYSRDCAIALAWVANAAYFAYFDPQSVAEYLTYSGLYVFDLLQFYNNQTELIGFVAKVESADQLLVAFTGTQPGFLPETVVADLDIGLVPFVPTPGGSVSRGFLAAWESVRHVIFDSIASSETRITRVWFASHSLGGAVATLAAADVSYQLNNSSTRLSVGRQQSPPSAVTTVVTYTFASPRVGDEAFVKSYSTLPRLYSNRIANYYDLIPRLPISDYLGYQHVSVLILLWERPDETTTGLPTSSTTLPHPRQGEKSGQIRTRHTCCSDIVRVTCRYDAPQPCNILLDPFDWLYEHRLETYLYLLSNCGLIQR